MNPDNHCHVISPTQYHKYFLEGQWVEGYKVNRQDFVTEDLYQAYVYEDFLYFVEKDEESKGFAVCYKRCKVENLEMYGIFYRE